jgi:hypothetical protein
MPTFKCICQPNTALKDKTRDLPRRIVGEPVLQKYEDITMNIE